jgi:class 3 adenylate cyclase/DNA-binding response OmpR family regulator
MSPPAAGGPGAGSPGPPAAAGPGAGAMGSPVPAAPGESASPSARVLVVDDNETNRDVLSRRLAQQGHAVSVAEDGEQALAALAARDYDLVLLDIMMPGLNGYEVLERVRADDRLRQVPVIVVSAVEHVQSVVRCLQMGAEDYVTKPFDPALLRARVEACLEKKRLRDREQAHLRRLEGFNETLTRRVAEATAEVRAQSETLERRVRELTALSEVSMAINSVMDVTLVLERILELSKEVMRAEASSLLVLDREAGRLRFHVAKGAAGAALVSATVDLGQGIAGWVAASGQSLLIQDAYQDPRFDPSYDRLTGFHTRSILTVPLAVKNEILGVVQVINKVGEHAFDERDLGLFQLFAGMASVALENARLFEQTRKMADDLRKALEAERRLAIEKEKMGHYIARHVVDEISRNREQALALGGRLVRTTILFSDIQGFTKLSETLGPQEVVSFLNEYMTAMTEVIESEGGIIDKFIGDGIMAVFLPQDDDDNHALRAVRSGIRMQQRLAALRQGWRAARPEVAELRVRIGINTGEVVSGNIGSQTRMDYTVVGDNVNVTSRIESNAQPDAVYISEATYLEVKDHVRATRLDPIKVKNRVQPVQVYSVDLPPPGGR